MRLTAYSNFSLRTLMVAAMRAPRLTTVQEVADAFGISRAHLVKCVHRLGRWGYLENLRGNRGGFRLARPAEAITIGEVVRRTEEGFDLVECLIRSPRPVRWSGAVACPRPWRRATPSSTISTTSPSPTSSTIATRSDLLALDGTASATEPACEAVRGLAAARGLA